MIFFQIFPPCLAIFPARVPISELFEFGKKCCRAVPPVSGIVAPRRAMVGCHGQRCLDVRRAGI
jgi:hypothetical protein